MDDDEKHAMPIAEQIPARSKGKIPAVLHDKINSVYQSASSGKSESSTVKRAMHQKCHEVHDAGNKPAKPNFLSASLGCAAGNLAGLPHTPKNKRQHDKEHQEKNQCKCHGMVEWPNAPRTEPRRTCG
jgi:hypothetical protein